MMLDFLGVLIQNLTKQSQRIKLTLVTNSLQKIALSENFCSCFGSSNPFQNIMPLNSNDTM